ncbi:MAG TPA: class I mannose-6-phosphate isomerase [Sphingomicrobium sp.]|jgi:mannose-6-phosphate isomerase|nr:class I mannose-6-phosphate isomerase [Sphingomicrobium sp.]
MKLQRCYIEKPWGRSELPQGFEPPYGKRIGEVWFTGAGDQPLLAKYLFTSERLSIQVHPDDAQARARGLPRGKFECWYIVSAEPNSTLGLGLKSRLSPGELRSAALDGSIEELIDWRRVAAGDFFLVPPGTIHAIGAGISLIEFQQNSDVTYRLYDYGRPRELHLQDGISVSSAEPYSDRDAGHLDPSEHRVLVDGPEFVLVHSTADSLEDRTRWIIPIEGKVRSGDEIAEPGECLLLEAGERIEIHAARMLIGASV